MELQKELYNKLKKDKIKINWNKNPIKMEMFLSFIKVEVIRSHQHLGSFTGWTLLENDKLNLRISGGVVGGIEYLDSLVYGHRLENVYNDFVNPFYLFDILTESGKKFFVDYYIDDIEKILNDQKNQISSLKQKLENELEIECKLIQEINFLREIKLA